MRFLSIDPGVSGGLAVLEFESQKLRVTEVADTPLMPRTKSGKGSTVNYAALNALLDRWQPGFVVLEQVSGQLGRGAGQKMGNSGAFNFGMGFGILIGCVSRIPHELVPAQSWKKRMGIGGTSGPGAEKDYARVIALRLYPYLGAQLDRKKDVGRAEAILVGTDWYNRTWAGK